MICFTCLLMDVDWCLQSDVMPDSRLQGCAANLGSAGYQAYESYSSESCSRRRSSRQIRSLSPPAANDTAGLLAGLGVGGSALNGEQLPPVVRYIRAGLTVRLGIELWAAPLFGGDVITADGSLTPTAEAWALVNDTVWTSAFRAAATVPGEGTIAEASTAYITAEEVAQLSLSRPLSTLAGPPLPQWRADVAIQRWNNTVARHVGDLAADTVPLAGFVDLADFTRKLTLVRTATQNGSQMPVGTITQAFAVLEEQEATVAMTVPRSGGTIAIAVPAAPRADAARSNVTGAPGVDDDDVVCIRLASNVTLFEREVGEQDDLEPIVRLLNSTMIDGPRAVATSSGQIFENSGRALTSALGEYHGNQAQTDACPNVGDDDGERCERADLQQRVPVDPPGTAAATGSHCSSPFGPVHLGLGAALAQSFEGCCHEHAQAYSDCTRAKSDADDDFRSCMVDITSTYDVSGRSAISPLSATAAEEFGALSVRVLFARSVASAFHASAAHTATDCSRYSQRQRHHCMCPDVANGTQHQQLSNNINASAVFPAPTITHVRLFADANSSSIARVSASRPSGNFLLLDELAAQAREACSTGDLASQAWVDVAFNNATAPFSMSLPPCAAVRAVSSQASALQAGVVFEAQSMLSTGGIAMVIASLSVRSSCADNPCLGADSVCSATSGSLFCQCGPGNRSGLRCEMVAGVGPAIPDTCDSAATEPAPSPSTDSPIATDSADGAEGDVADGLPAWAMVLCIAVALAIVAAIIRCRRNRGGTGELQSPGFAFDAREASTVDMIANPMITNLRPPQGLEANAPPLTKSGHEINQSAPDVECHHAEGATQDSAETPPIIAVNHRAPPMPELNFSAFPAMITAAAPNTGVTAIIHSADQRWCIPLASAAVGGGQPIYNMAFDGSGQPQYNLATGGGQPTYDAASGGQPQYNLATGGGQPTYDAASGGQPQYNLATGGGQPTYDAASGGQPTCNLASSGDNDHDMYVEHKAEEATRFILSLGGGAKASGNSNNVPFNGLPDYADSLVETSIVAIGLGDDFYDNHVVVNHHPIMLGSSDEASGYLQVEGAEGETPAGFDSGV